MQANFIPLLRSPSRQSMLGTLSIVRSITDATVAGATRQHTEDGHPIGAAASEPATDCSRPSGEGI